MSAYNETIEGLLKQISAIVQDKYMLRLTIDELTSSLSKLSKLLGKQYAMNWDELEAMLDRVANDGWNMQLAKEWIKLWQNPREIENPYEDEIKALRAENAKLEEVADEAREVIAQSGMNDFRGLEQALKEFDEAKK